jgi:hypothetical protein
VISVDTHIGPGRTVGVIFFLGLPGRTKKNQAAGAYAVWGREEAPALGAAPWGKRRLLELGLEPWRWDSARGRPCRRHRKGLGV